MLEAALALFRRYARDWSDEDWVITGQGNLANCLYELNRHDEALALNREIYASAALGVSNERTIMCGVNLASSLLGLELWDEAAPLLRDQLLPAARRSLGADHHLTLGVNQNLATGLADNPECTRDDPRFNRPRRGAGPRF